MLELEVEEQAFLLAKDEEILVSSPYLYGGDPASHLKSIGWLAKSSLVKLTH